MADQLGYTGAINKYDIDNFTAYTGAVDGTVTLPMRVSGANRRMTGTAFRAALNLKEFNGKYATLAALNGAVTSPVTNSTAYLDATTGATGGSSAAGWVYWNGTAWQAFDLAVTAGGAMAYDSLSIGAVTARIARLGGTACTLTNPSTGVYLITIPVGAHVSDISFFATNAHVAGDNSITVQVNNAANARDRRLSVDQFTGNTGSLQNAHTNGTVPTITYTANVSSCYVPGFAGYGATGCFLEFR